MSAKTYDFSQVAVTVGGFIMSGFDEGDDCVKVEPDEDEFSLKVGADGEGTRSKTLNKSGTITLRFQKASQSNDDLNTILQADRASNAGLVPVSVKDNSGREIHFAETAWIQKAPPANHGAEAGAREWILRTDRLVSTHGGN